MKLSDLLEEPVIYDSGQHADKAIDLFQSDRALIADFKPIFSMNTTLGNIRFLAKKHPENSLIRGVVQDQDDIGRSVNRIIFQLKFKAKTSLINFPHEIDSGKCLQVNSVFISDDFRKLGIASRIYKFLTSAGFVIISDSSQYEDGKELWKKLVRDTVQGKYKIYVLDDEYGFKKDAAGKPIEYDGTNIKDSEIWTSGDDFSGYHKLLVMKA